MVKKIDEEFEELEEKIFDTFMERNPVMATHIGIHDYDDILPDVTKQAHEEDIKMMENWLEEIKNFDDKKLSDENQIAKKLGIHLFDLMLFRMKELEHWKKQPSVPDTIGSSILLLIKREFSPLNERLTSIKGRIEDIPRIVEEEKTRIEDPVKLWVDMAIESTERLPMMLKLVLMIAKENGLEDKKLSELSSAVDEADQALEDYKDWLNELRMDAKNEFAIGEEKFDELLEKREIGYSTDEIYELGKELLENAKEDMKKYAEQINPDKTTQEVVQEVMSETPDDFEEAISWYEKGLEDAKEFVIKNDLATIPKSESIEVIETPEYMRHIIPFAAYMPPAKFDEVHKGIYMVTPPNKEKELDNYSYWDVRNTTVHEGYPGHHLQTTAACENDDVFRLFSHAVETIEGWAHYCEEMMKDHGFDDTPEARLVQTRDVVWRAARIIVDIELSTNKISFDEAVEYLVDTVGMKKEDATAEVKRYTQNPAYQLSYLLGKVMIKELKNDVKEQMGDNFSEKFFHDTILYAGGVPIKYLKKIFDKKIKE
ncbi:MAG: DUF885 domain-containing protein [Thermoplasmatota archaeon]